MIYFIVIYVVGAVVVGRQNKNQDEFHWYRFVRIVDNRSIVGAFFWSLTKPLSSFFSVLLLSHPGAAGQYGVRHLPGRHNETVGEIQKRSSGERSIV